MSSHTALVKWQIGTEDFISNKYSRGHNWHFDGGEIVPASASPHIVPLPYSVEENVDPEEAFIASLSSCHMLFFLSIAAKKKYQIESYTDNVEGVMGCNENGKQAMIRVTLNPDVIFSGSKQPSQQDIEKLHHLAHENCFLANSVNCDIVVNC